MELWKSGNEKWWLLIISVMIIISPALVNSSTNGEDGLTWSIPAAKEAERVAAINCSGHGHAYIDGILDVNGTPSCECNTCYNGTDCSQLLPNCPADAAVGDAMFLEDYWLNNKERSAILISGWSRMSYYTSGPDYISLELEKYIKLLHYLVGNAVADNKYIVFGNGVTQLINSFVLALSRPKIRSLTTKRLNVVARAPYYPVFRRQTRLFDSKYYEWKGNAISYENTTTPRDFIEFVTSPNNPDGHLSHSVIYGSLVITDAVYYWPHFTPIVDRMNEDIMMFSMSKFTGHAGSRFGWALVKNQTVYEAVAKQYVTLNSEGSSHDAQQRTLILLKDIVEKIQDGDHSNDISYYGYEVMKRRWEQLEAVISRTDRFSLQSRPRRYCNYMKKYRRLTPGFAWLKCNYANETDCENVLINGGIKSEGGEDFEADARYARLSLIKTQDDFDQLIARLVIMVKEKGLSTSM